MRTTWISILAAGSLIGCSALDVSAVEQRIEPPCTYLTCSNSPETLYHGMYDANLLGAPNAQGISIQAEHGRAQIYQAGVGYDLEVVNSRIRGKRPGHPPLEGDALVDAEIVLLREQQILYIIHIDGVRTIPYAYGPAATLEVYRMTWREKYQAPTPDQPVCNELLWIEEKKYRWGELLGMENDEVLVFEGDRIDADAYTMSQKPDPSWFNISCAGRALAKLHLTRNTIASLDGPDSGAAWRQRQAMFKMLAADYCGTGRAFTVSGAKVTWQGGYVGYLREPTTIDARWSEKGATCLGTPRMLAHPDVTTLFGELELEIAAECPDLPDCTNADAWDFADLPVVSANY